VELFGELYGNEKLKATAASDILRGRPSHAYIIEGPEGSGRHTAARLIASSVLCEREDANRFPCGKCLPCRKVSDGVCTDVIYVNRGRAASIGIDVIRDVKSSLSFAPVESKYKIYIIEEADRMTAAAQNSLLLSLEEPPSFVIFILICSDSSSLLETVRSRAQTIRMQLFPADEILSYLKAHKTGSSKNDPSAAAASSGGAIGKAEALLTGEASDGLRDAALCREALPLLLSRSAEERLSLVKKLPSKRDDVVRFLKVLLNAVRDLMCVKTTRECDLLFFTDRAEAEGLASRIDVKRLSSLAGMISSSIEKISANVSIQPVLLLLVSSK